MAEPALEQIVSSRARLKIAALLSVRPRTLRELGRLTGISVQAVLKHLEKLDELGILEETKVKGRELSVRKLYSMKDVRVGDFSLDGLMVVKMSRSTKMAVRKGESALLGSISEETLFQKQRIREQSRRLARMIDELLESEARLNAIMDALKLRDDERLILRTFYTEETLGEAEDSLRKNYGMTEPRRAIDRLNEKVRSVDR